VRRCAGRELEKAATRLKRGGHMQILPLDFETADCSALFDGLSALLSAPEVAPGIVRIVIGSTSRGSSQGLPSATSHRR
jgi:hypothetical protein